MRKRQISISYGVFWAVLVPVEIACAFLAYWTISEVTMLLYLFVVTTANLGLLVIAIWSRPLAFFGGIVLGLLIIPYQLALGRRLLQLDSETRRIVAFLNEQKERTGAFPDDLSSYTFQDHATQTYVTYRPSPNQNEFELFYYVGTPNTSHLFSSRRGWSYYPD
jgi:hypothetical protein